jgi:type III secretory pathway component EscS
VFRNPVGEFRLTGARSGRRPTPLFKPALEALEERIVLSGATVPLPARAQALAAVNPAVAVQKVIGTLTTSVQQYTQLQSQVLDLVVQMGNLPAGTPRLSLARQAVTRINAFAKQEKGRFQKFQALARRVHGSDLFANYAQLYRSLHASLLTVNTQATFIGKLLYTTVTVPVAKSLTGRSAQKAVTRLSGLTSLTPDEADGILFVMAILVSRFEGSYAGITARAGTNPLCGYYCLKNDLDDIDERLAVFEFISILVAPFATKDGKTFLAEELATLNSLRSEAAGAVAKTFPNGYAFQFSQPAHPPPL